MEFVIVLVVLVVVVFVVTGPLRRERASRGSGAAGDDRGANELAELEATREAKYREIRDAELDHRTGKLSDADFDTIDRSLRAEAIEILRALDRIGGAEEPSDETPASAKEDPASPAAE